MRGFSLEVGVSWGRTGTPAGGTPSNDLLGGAEITVCLLVATLDWHIPIKIVGEYYTTIIFKDAARPNRMNLLALNCQF